MELLSKPAIHILVITCFIFNTVWIDQDSVNGFRKIVRMFDREEGKVWVEMLITAYRVVLEVLVGFMKD